MIAHRDPTAVSLQGWFPGSGDVTELRSMTGSAPSQTLTGSVANAESILHYRCGGSAGIQPASQFSRLAAGTFSASTLAGHGQGG
jgi:hypothetical protein